MPTIPYFSGTARATQSSSRATQSSSRATQSSSRATQSSQSLADRYATLQQRACESNKFPNTGFEQAIESRDINKISEYLKYYKNKGGNSSISVNQRSYSSPLHLFITIVGKKPKISDEFLKAAFGEFARAEADFNHPGYNYNDLGVKSPLHLAAQIEDERVLKFFLQAAPSPLNLNLIDAKGKTPLAYASENRGPDNKGLPEMVRSLLVAGADPNMSGEGGDKPIEVAKSPSISTILKEGGAKTSSKETPGFLYWTAQHGTLDELKALINQGYKVNYEQLSQLAQYIQKKELISFARRQLSEKTAPGSSDPATITSAQPRGGAWMQVTQAPAPKQPSFWRSIFHNPGALLRKIK